jgi:hypothetical protein
MTRRIRGQNVRRISVRVSNKPPANQCCVEKRRVAVKHYLARLNAAKRFLAATGSCFSHARQLSAHAAAYNPARVNTNAFGGVVWRHQASDTSPAGRRSMRASAGHRESSRASFKAFPALGYCSPISAIPAIRCGFPTRSTRSSSAPGGVCGRGQALGLGMDQTKLRQVVENEADRINDKAKRVAGKLRTPSIPASSRHVFCSHAAEQACRRGSESKCVASRCLGLASRVTWSMPTRRKTGS